MIKTKAINIDFNFFIFLCSFSFSIYFKTEGKVKNFFWQIKTETFIASRPVLQEI